MRELQAMFMECIIERNRISFSDFQWNIEIEMEHCRKLG